MATRSERANVTEQHPGTQERSRRVCDCRVVLARDERTRNMKLPPELYRTDEKAALGAWVLLDANIAPPQDAPVADPTPRAMSRTGLTLSPKLRHTDILP